MEIMTYLWVPALVLIAIAFILGKSPRGAIEVLKSIVDSFKS